MSTCGNFLEYAAQKCGMDVGYGKMIILFKDKTSIPVSQLTADNINAKIVSGDIIGIVKDWMTVAGAPVAEISVERTGSQEMKLIKAEVAADTITFESTLINREVIGELVKAGSLYGIIVDDLGNAFGEKSLNINEITPMLLNFSSKVTSSFQYDNTNEKTVAVTVRYLFKELDFVPSVVDPELINYKKMLNIYLSSLTTLTATSAVFVLALKYKGNGKMFDGAVVADDLTITGGNITTKTCVFDANTGLLTVTLDGTGFSTIQQIFNITISGDTIYSKETVVILGE